MSLELIPFFAVLPTLLSWAKSEALQSWAADVTVEVTGGVAGQLLEGSLDSLGRERRKALNETNVRSRLQGALNLALSCTLSQLCDNMTPPQQGAFVEALKTWVANEQVQNCFGRQLDPRKDSDLELETLSTLFEACAPRASLKSLELDFRAFLAWLVGCFCEAIKEDEALNKHFALTDLEQLAYQAVKQSALQEQIQKNTTVSMRLQALQLTEAQQTNQHLAEIKDRLEEPAREKAQAQSAARQAWLEVISSECSNIPLQGLDTDATDSERAKKTKLSGIYIALNTTSWIEQKKGRRKAKGLSNPFDDLNGEETRPLTVLEGIAKTARMVLLGAPGSGKSTVLRHLALCLAQGQLATEADDRQKWHGQLSPLKGDQLERLPVVVVLRELAAWLEAHTPQTTPASMTASRAQALLKRYLEEWCKDHEAQPCLEDLWTALKQGQALLLLDGLDEIPPTGPRIGQVKALLESLAEDWRKTPMVVTCRVLSWQDPRWKLEPQWKSFELDALDDAQIADFIRHWYEQLAEGGHIKKAGEKIQRLQQAVERPELRELAGNPLLLTVMALLHGHRGDLPDTRVMLYEEAVNLLLLRWEKTNKEGLDRSRALQDWLSQGPCKLTDLTSALSRVAYSVHVRAHVQSQQANRPPTLTADIPERALMDELVKLHPREEGLWVRTGLELIKERAGLLVESQPGVYQFPHRTFQEYLAARHLSEQENFADLVLSQIVGGTYWWEAIRLAVGRFNQVGIGREKALALVAELSPLEAPLPRNTYLWSRIWLAGEVLHLLGGYARERQRGQELLERTRAHLVRLLELGALSPRERHEAGLVLGHLGDPRLGLEKPENWIWIPPGEFMMGTRDGLDDEKPVHSVTLTQGFFMSRFPVTNHDFKAFIDAGGYRHKQWWSEDGWKFCLKHRLQAPERWTDSRWNAPNQPTVGVSWYEAEAYCRWLTNASSPRDGGIVIRLPTEAEWEFAARGNEGRKYPWGNETLTLERANSLEAGLQLTSPVGAFPLGASKEGMLDLVGNVWEWCRDWYGVYPNAAQVEPTGPISGYSPVLRGGGWNVGGSYARAACRIRVGADAHLDFLGFRLVRVSPQPPTPPGIPPHSQRPFPHDS